MQAFSRPFLSIFGHTLVSGRPTFLGTAFGTLCLGALLSIPSVSNAQVQASQPGDGATSDVTAQSELLLEDDRFQIPEEEEEALELGSESEEVIVITGTAIQRRVLTTPAPVAVLDKSDLDAAGKASIGEILQTLPSQSNAINIQNNNGGTGATRINLRGLGSNRTLVLVNGRRHVPGGNGANSAVDLNAIPTAIIERVEVLKDGASAIYGSDAIGGVVNIITRSDFEGTEASAFLGTTEDGLGSVYDISVVSGYNSDKGNVIFSAGYFNQQSMGAGDRDYSKYAYTYSWDEDRQEGITGSTATPQGTLFVPNDDVSGNATWGDLLDQCPSGACVWDPSQQQARDFEAGGIPDAPDGFADGDRYNYQPDNYLLTPNERYNVFSKGTYQFHEHARGFFEATYMNRSSDQQLAPEPLFLSSEQISISADNYYNPFGRDIPNFNRRLVEFGTRRTYQDINTFRIVGGLEGRLPRDLPAFEGWRWEMSYNYGTTRGNQVNEGNLNRQRLIQSIGPSHFDADGNLRCGASVDAASDSRCVPMNLLGMQTMDDATLDEVINWLTYTGTAKGFNDQHTVRGNSSGKLFDLPGGGDLSLALGLSYRDESGGNQPDPLTAAGDTTGNKTEPTEGGYQVGEGYAELSLVPILRQPGAEWVEINAAARAFDYNTFGSGTTWKVGGLWRFGHGAALRGTYSTAFRAPSIAELYSGQFDSFPTATDPCDTSSGQERSEVAMRRCSEEVADNFRETNAQLKTRVGGNDELDPETADTWTLGAVYEPQFARGLAFTLDYFNIELDDAIQNVGATTILENCYERDFQESCDKIQRGMNGNISSIDDRLTNIGGQDTSGLDFNIRYDLNTANLGNFRFNLAGTWLQAFDAIQPDGSALKGKGYYDLGHYPEWKGNVSAIWARKAWAASAKLQYVGALEECFRNNCNREEIPDEEIRDVDDYMSADVSGSYTLNSTAGITRLTLGVNNVTDATPSKIYNGFTATSEPSAYSFLGRYFYMRFVQSF